MVVIMTHRAGARPGREQDNPTQLQACVSRILYKEIGKGMKDAEQGGFGGAAARQVTSPLIKVEVLQ